MYHLIVNTKFDTLNVFQCPKLVLAIFRGYTVLLNYQCYASLDGPDSLVALSLHKNFKSPFKVQVN